MIRWLADLPGWVLFPLMVAIGAALTLLFAELVRRHVPAEVRSRAGPTAAVTLQVLATMYAILIAFVIVDEYTQLRSAQSEISDKAAALSTLFENSRAFPVAEGALVRSRTLDYARAFTTDTMPHLGEEASPDRATDRKLEAIFQAVQEIEPADQSQRAAYDAMLEALDSIARTRSNLVGSAKSTVPLTLLVLLFVIGLTVMAVAATLDTRHHRSHVLLLSALALVVWMTLALLVSLDYPFNGIIKVSDAPVRQFVQFRSAR
jgi:Protein of unknown function (DUF4239)